MIQGMGRVRGVLFSRYTLKEFSLSQQFFPIYFFLAYLGVTILLFAFGPWRYPLGFEPLVYLYGFLFLANGSLFFGYLTGIRQPKRISRSAINVVQLQHVACIATLLLFIPTCLHRTGSWYPDIVSGIADPGRAYRESLLIRELGASYAEYARIFAGPLLAMVLPLTVFYWSELRWRTRILGLTALLSTILLFIAMGTNKAIADTVLLVPCMVVAGQWAGTLRINLARGPLFLFCAASFVAFLMFFSWTMAGRTGSTANAGYMPSISDRADTDVVGHLIPAGYMPGYLGLTSYLTQGYYALGLSLQEPFVPTWGIGNSMFLTKQVDRFLADHPVTPDTYPVRIEKHGWDALHLWSSIYPWLASDVTFPGVIFLMFWIGRILAWSWTDALNGADPMAVVVFSLLCIMIFYFPANNQVLQSGEGFTAFWGTLVIWLHRRSKSLQIVRTV